MYDPNNARFLQEDTYLGDINDPLSLNLYTYCANNPLIYDDQNGHSLSNIWGYGVNKLKEGVQYLADKTKETAKYLAGEVVDFADYVEDKAVQLYDYTENKLTQAWNHTKDKASEAWNNFQNEGKSFVENPGQYIANKRQYIAQKSNNVVYNVAKKVERSTGISIEEAKSAVSSCKTVLNDAKLVVEFGKIVNGISDEVSNRISRNLYKEMAQDDSNQSICNYSREDADKLINSRIFGIGIGPKVYWGNEISSLPKEITYKDDYFTYTYALDERKMDLMGMESRGFGDFPIRDKDGRIIDTKQYEYKLTYSNAPPVSCGTVQSLPKGIKGAAEPKLGGAYKDVPANGGQVHHMPADSISPYSKGKGPGIRMETREHMDTASWGSSKKAKQYRQKQKELIEQGKFREAQQMDIDDVRSKFNDKYDDAIEQMKKYTDELLNKDK